MMLLNVHVIADQRNCSVLDIVCPEEPKRAMTLAEMNYIVAYKNIEAKRNG